MKARAKRIDNDEIVEGYYTELVRITNKISHEKGNFIVPDIELVEPKKIDSETLEYKINDEWYSMEQLEIRLAGYEMFMINQEIAESEL